MVIEVSGLTKRYGGVPAVDGVSFAVATGEVFGLVGRNGAGKTTTVECVAGLRHLDGGGVRVFGGDPTCPAIRARIGVQLQHAGCRPCAPGWRRSVARPRSIPHRVRRPP